jgi:tetratricopeptide (TPR) repeat protein
LRAPEPLAEAERLFRQAIAIDPDYAPAYAGLATALIFRANFGQAEELAAHAQAEAAIEKALELDPHNSEAFAALGLLRSSQGRYEEARVALRRTVALNPNDAQAYYWLSMQYHYSDPFKALELNQRAYEINPLTPIVAAGLAWRFDALGRYDEAMRQARKYYELFQDERWAFRIAADLCAHQGCLDAALKGQFRAYRARPEDGLGFVTVPILFLTLGEPDLAAAWVAELQRAKPLAPQVTLPHIVISAARGELPAAIEAAKAAAAATDNLWLDQALAVAYLLNGDAELARSVFEQALPEIAQDPPQWEPAYYVMMINYSVALQMTGADDRAAALLEEISSLLMPQVAQGVVWGPRGTLLEELAMIRSLQGRPEEALDYLREAARQVPLICLHCLDIFVHYDNVRGEPGFAAVVADQRAKADAQLRKLADEELLLTPEGVAALETFEFDPLAD